MSVPHGDLGASVDDDGVDPGSDVSQLETVAPAGKFAGRIAQIGAAG